MRLAWLSLAVVLGLAVSARPTRAAETADAAPAPGPEPRKSLAPVVGLQLGTVATGRYLGPAIAVSFEASLRKRFEKLALVAGLRPQYERYGLGFARHLGCADGAACSSGSLVYRTETSAHALALEVPLVAEYHAKDLIPFLGVAPSMIWLRATERTQGLVPSATPVESSGSKAFFAFSAFAGLAVPVGKHGFVAARAGYRFAPDADLPGGSASVRGVLGAIGYTYEL